MVRAKEQRLDSPDELSSHAPRRCADVWSGPARVVPLLGAGSGVRRALLVAAAAASTPFSSPGGCPRARPTGLLRLQVS
jgi:hypothetical protein